MRMFALTTNQCSGWLGTGKFQPNDVGIQRIFKFIVKTEATQFLIKEMKKQLTENPRQRVVLPTEIGILRNASVAWIQKAHEYFASRPEAVKKVSCRNLNSIWVAGLSQVVQGWARCTARGWDLSYETLTSERARSTLNERIDDDPSFALSIADIILPEQEDDTAVDGVEFDDDLGADTDTIASLHSVPSSSAPDSGSNSERAPRQDLPVAKLNEDGDVELTGGSLEYEAEDTQGEDPVEESDNSSEHSAMKTASDGANSEAGDAGDRDFSILDSPGFNVPGELDGASDWDGGTPVPDSDGASAWSDNEPSQAGSESALDLMDADNEDTREDSPDSEGTPLDKITITLAPGRECHELTAGGGARAVRCVSCSLRCHHN